MDNNDYAGWAAGLGLVGIVIAVALYLGTLALTLWVFYLIIRTAVKNGILKADEERALVVSIRRDEPSDVVASAVSSGGTADG